MGFASTYVLDMRSVPFRTLESDFGRVLMKIHIPKLLAANGRISPRIEGMGFSSGCALGTNG